MIKHFFLWSLFIILIVSAVGCSKTCSSCNSVGTCSSTGCSCPDPWSGAHCDTQCTIGYEGYHCQTFSKTKFFGTWSCTSAPPSANSQTFFMTFTDTVGGDVFMKLNNFNNKGYTVQCVMTGKDKFEVNLQTTTTSPHHEVTGFASMFNGKITLYITEDHIDYFATAYKQ